MKTWYRAKKQVIQGVLLLMPVVVLFILLWYYKAFSTEYDKIVVGKGKQTVTGHITQIQVDTQLVQRRWRGNLAIRYKVYYQFKIDDSTYKDIQILPNNWKNQHWVQTKTLKEKILVEYNVTDPNMNRIVIE